MWGFMSFITLCCIIQLWGFKKLYQFRIQVFKDIDDKAREAYRKVQPHIAMRVLQEKECCIVCGSASHIEGKVEGIRVVSLHPNCSQKLQMKFVSSAMAADLNSIEMSPHLKELLNPLHSELLNDMKLVDNKTGKETFLIKGKVETKLLNDGTISFDCPPDEDENVSIINK